jgi:aspartyl-tRNA(Asn)/glutamyl-tRNA(Gln) amidotransferase subunit A
MTDSDLAFETISELASRIRTGGLSPVALTESLLARAERLNGRLHAFRWIEGERAIAQAKAAELSLRSNRDLGPLHGIPYAVKDLFDVNGLSTTAGTRLLEENVARRDSEVVRKLSQAGMVLLGKTHTVQFAFGGVGINHDQGTPHNPWHREPHVPGGSSSGSAVAVAAGMVKMGLGTDTGGSVRIPSSLCGIVGLKTTIGRVSRAGVFPLSWTQDSVGPLARCVEDVALTYQAIQGVDPEDESTLGVVPNDTLRDLKRGVRGLRIAFGETVFFDEVEGDVERLVRSTGEVFRELGAQVIHAQIPEAKDAMASQKRALMVAAEGCAANGHWLDSHFEDLDPIVSHRLAAGRGLSAADYVSLIREWSALRKRVVETLQDIDAVIVPTTALAAKPVSTVDEDLETYAGYNGRYLRNTAIGNILNLTGVSLPCGFDSHSLPVGLMVYAKPFQEHVALRVAFAYEQATRWHQCRPDLSWAE